MFTVLRDKNGQVAPFMVLVMAVLILAIAATMIIGETGFTRLRMANIGDSALISAASSFCRSLNSMRPLHNQMLYNYITFQTAMIARAPFLHKAQAYAMAAALTALYVEQSYELFDRATEIADAMPKDLRTSVYDTVLGGALIDEPKPFLEGLEGSEPAIAMHPLSLDTCDSKNLIGWNEVGRDPQTNVINYLNYPKYAQRDSHFTCQYRNLKSDSGWYNRDSVSYSFNKALDKFKVYPGKIGTDPDDPIINPIINQATGEKKFDAYLRARLENFPDSVDIIPMVMPIVFLYWEWCVVVYPIAEPVYQPCWIMPGFTVDPFAWIAWIDFKNNFSLIVNKKVPFTRIPFFSRTVELQHTSRVNIRGSVWSGYDFSIQ